MNERKIGAMGILIAAALLFTACSASGTTLIPSQTNAPAAAPTTASTLPPQSSALPQTAPAVPDQAGLLESYEGTLKNIYQQVIPSVVNIRVVQKQGSLVEGLSPNGMPELPFALPGMPDQQGPQYSQGLGSGFVWDQEGHIITNNHVVEGADKVEVTFSDGVTLPATVVGTDSYSDLAVIRVEQAGEQLKPVQMADSAQVKVGQLAIAIGNPFGLEGTMTVGIVSAIGRTLAAGEALQGGGSFSIPSVIQTDAPINPGNSGGVLVDTQGRVIGVTAAIESPVRANAGIGFAIPSALVRKVAPGLIKDGKYEHAYLGISGTTLTPDLAAAMKLDKSQRGALVETVTSGGPADKAGLHGSGGTTEVDGQEIHVGGDVIVAVDESPVKTMDDLITYLFDQTDVGQTVTLSVLRDGKEKQMDAVLEARPAPKAQGQAQAQGQQSGGVWLGVQAQPVTPEIAQAMGLPKGQKGVLIGQVETGSPADQAGLLGSYKPVEINGSQILVGGDVLTRVDGVVINSVPELREQLAQKQAGDEVTLTVIREGRQIEVSVTLAERPAPAP
ncbi:MAG: trypsin-like peptidase domain-containing protein [Anaerolineaceae bacterium]|nr:trypsin-like peptidase domain-containing protein [Anaerolineaceae bacterium]